MSELLFVLNVLFAGALLAEGLWRRTGYLEVPFLFGATYALWFLPEAYALLDDPTLPSDDLSRVLLMSLLCLILTYVGWRIGLKRPPQKPAVLDIPVERLVMPTLAITLFAVAIRLAIDAQPVEARAMTQWTGPLTILVFLASIGSVSLVLSTAMLLKKPTKVTLLLAAANLAPYVLAAFVSFRRSSAFQLVFAALLSLYFVRGRTAPRFLVAAMLFIGLFYVNGIGELRYRSGGYELDREGRLVARSLTLDDLSNIDWSGVIDFKRYRSNSEVRNAAVWMMVASRSDFSFGATLWNGLVFAYVPGQLIGRDLKQGLMIDADVSTKAYQEYGYQATTGATSTGFVHPYLDFGYLGAGVFLILAYITGHWYGRALSGSFTCFALYGVTLYLIPHVITHFGYIFFVNSILPIVAALFAARYAHSLRRKGVKRAGPPTEGPDDGLHLRL